MSSRNDNTVYSILTCILFQFLYPRTTSQDHTSRTNPACPDMFTGIEYRFVCHRPLSYLTFFKKEEGKKREKKNALTGLMRWRRRLMPGLRCSSAKGVVDYSCQGFPLFYLQLRLSKSNNKIPTLYPETLFLDQRHASSSSHMTQLG